MSLAILCALVAVGCGLGEHQQSADTEPVAAPELDKLVVYTVNYPLAYFADRIGGDLVEVNFPAPEGEDPAFWSPEVEIIAAFQGADLILLNGGGYAKWVERATLPSSRVIDTSAGFADRLLPIEGTVTHSHGPEGEHEHVGWAVTTWLDPEIAGLHAQAVAAAISDRRPDQRSEIEARLQGLVGDLHTLDERLRAATSGLGDTAVLFSQPVYQYLISRYGLTGIELHWEPGIAPNGHDWGHLAADLKERPVNWMVWEGEPLPATVLALEERGISSVVFDPCGNRPAEGDFMTVMTANAEALERIAE